MPVLTYNPSTRMAVMDGPLGPVEAELSSREDWPLPVPLNELGRYFVKCFGDVPDSVRQAPCVIQTFPDNLLEISFRNSVGLTRIGPLPVVVQNRKIAEPQYQTMLDAVVAKVASLIFGFAQPTGQNVQRGQPGKDVAYLEMCFLRMALLREKPDIDAIAGAILADPHRLFQRVRSPRRMEDVTEVNPEAWAELATRPQGLCRIADGHPLTATALGKSLRRASGQWLFPRELVVEEKRQSVDTPENRFMKHFLGVLLHKVQVFRDTLGAASGGALNLELASEMQELDRKLRRFAQAGLWRDVGQMRFFPASSQILQRREGYRSLFRLHALLSLRTQCRFTLPDFARILETKDTPTLYEYWAFFVVKDALDARLRQQSLHVVHSDDQRERSMSHELVLGYEGDLRLCFNRTYSAPGQSYSHPLRPDITIEQCGRRLILDAKFKGAGSGFYGIEAEDGTIQRWREEDIDKMHAYRDAIAGVQGAFILYPGLETAMFTPSGQSFPGVGALALRPGEQASPNPEHAAALAQLIDRFCTLREGASC
ncbi:DUF2357 domain-containing protein [Desulfonatronum thioautotrophicum]|uniref:DUF2357 domain-containing protein n=1 Tax=Desulfonatronum thioautotrophicum TaxID=617001 RepID=UPI0005EBA531|nr:DUF2357 domain-containing protein [Desulfonatronum thioautotrophicum]